MGKRTLEIFLICALAGAFLIVSASIALAGPGDVTIGSPPSDPTSGDSFTVPVTIETTPGLPLGGYNLKIEYDSSAVTIDSISGGAATEFSTTPTASPATFTSGITAFAAINTASLTSPSGAVHVADITFNAVGGTGSTSALDLSVTGLSDTSGSPIVPNLINDGFITIGSGPPTGVNSVFLISLALTGLALGVFLIVRGRRISEAAPLASISTNISGGLQYFRSRVYRRQSLLAASRFDSVARSAISSRPPSTIGTSAVAQAVQRQKLPEASFMQVTALLLISALLPASFGPWLSPAVLAIIFAVPTLAAALALFHIVRKRKLRVPLPIVFMLLLIIVFSGLTSAALATSCNVSPGGGGGVPPNAGGFSESTSTPNSFDLLNAFTDRDGGVSRSRSTWDVSGDAKTNICDAVLLGQIETGMRLPADQAPRVSQIKGFRTGFDEVEFEVGPGAVLYGSILSIFNKRTGDSYSAPHNTTGTITHGPVSGVEGDEYLIFSSKGGIRSLLRDIAIGFEKPDNPATRYLDPATEQPPGGKCKDCQNGGGCGGDECNCAVCGSVQSSDGDPIEFFNGQFIREETDLFIKSRGFDFEFTRTYKNQVDYDGPLGHDWDFNYNKRLDRNPFTGDVDTYSGTGRLDSYLTEPDGSYTPPAGFFDRLKEDPGGGQTVRERDGTKYTYLPFDGTAKEGRLASITDRMRNRMTFEYDAGGRLTTIEDTLGREIVFTYDADWRIETITDFSGRTVTYEYDIDSNLIGVTRPAVTTHPGGNTFPGGKKIEYTYDSNHNLVSVINPKEATSTGTPMVTNTYDVLDRVIQQDWGGTNDSSVPAGGTVNISYDSSETSVTDRNGNTTIYRYNDQNLIASETILTNRDIRSSDPTSYTTSFEYNADGMLTKTTYPEGNETVKVYDTANPNRDSQANVLQIKQTPGPRGGDQDEIISSFTYEPIYNQVRTSVEPRGNDPSYVPHVKPDTTGTVRYQTSSTFDYQEGCNLPAIAAELEVSEEEASATLVAAGVPLELGDQNGDSIVSQAMGNTIKVDAPTVQLTTDSSLTAPEFEGDDTQEIASIFVYSWLSQLTRQIGSEGNIDTFSYFSESDPDGDGLPEIGAPALRRDTGGYLREIISDATSSTLIERRGGTAPRQISNSFDYDKRGNITSVTDGKGNTSSFTVNELDQLVEAISPGPFSYETRFYYDYNDNQIIAERENVTVDEAESNVRDSNEWLRTYFTYDLLDNLVRTSSEISDDTSAITRYRYDRNENLALRLNPAANLSPGHPDRQPSNVTSFVYDERDLLYQITRGGMTAKFKSLVAHDDIPETSTVPNSADMSTNTYNNDKNGNVNETIDAEDNNGDGQGESTLFGYDGFDRLSNTTDSAGGLTRFEYDPAGNHVWTHNFGQPGGSTPTTNTGGGNLRLAESKSFYDELNRRYRHHRAIFDNPGASEFPDQTSDAFEFDRSGRVVRTVDSGGHQTLFEYDGMDWLVRTEDAVGNEATSEYDQSGNLLRTISTDKSDEGLADESFTTAYSYDTLDRLVRSTDNIGDTRLLGQHAEYLFL